ncbi:MULTISPECIES: hypothetical protein [Brevundimonas]|jgi:hypothetical protein|uniref:Uncharacterized protein n=1 Tax=Brevundimonas variabilis TaxID=74312 RepID=A0A7W9FG72_9CAUL|nr:MULTISPECIES: hypothetical protein [Brevundimonas]MBB5746323.1 hypothetical protein [Brevundimonas variabilis]MBJ7447131.1 hypothetical protein [Brevundimonas sp.]
MTGQDYKIIIHRGERTITIVVDPCVANDRFIGLVDGVEVATAEDPSMVMAKLLSDWG